MNREIFLHQLRIRLSQLPEPEIEKRLEYYSELIEDMVEDGMSEEDAVASFGDINQIAQGIMETTALSTLVKTTVKPKNGWSTAAIVIAYRRVAPLGFAAAGICSCHRLGLFGHLVFDHIHLCRRVVPRAPRHLSVLQILLAAWRRLPYGDLYHRIRSGAYGILPAVVSGSKGRHPGPHPADSLDLRPDQESVY